jgi:hypothetical protein
LGIGDQLIATGLAKDAWTKRGKKIAFGDRGRILWDKHSEEIFRNNPNIAYPGQAKYIEWVEFYKGQRGYNRKGDGRWIWNMDWRCKPGEVFLTHGEVASGRRVGKGFIVIEPNVVAWKATAVNKDWGFDRYQELANKLIADGHEVVQFSHEGGGPILECVRRVKTSSFRDAIAILKNSALYVGAEGGMHHGAAAVGIKGVVLFGGWIPPSVTGYDMHTNIAGSDRFCGSFSRCDHCRDAMSAISIDTVYQATKERLRG